MGVSVGVGSGVGVAVAVGGTDVGVGVEVGGTAVAVAVEIGVAVAVGGTAVAVAIGGIGVAVGSAGEGPAGPQATKVRSKAVNTITLTTNRERVPQERKITLCLFFISFLLGRNGPSQTGRSRGQTLKQTLVDDGGQTAGDDRSTSPFLHDSHYPGPSRRHRRSPGPLSSSTE
jgi:hypothetical protein